MIKLEMATQESTKACVVFFEKEIKIYRDHIDFMDGVVDGLYNKIFEQHTTIIDLKQKYDELVKKVEFSKTTERMLMM
jgi:hypothetical protein